jgi:hypothetical protein
LKKEYRSNPLYIIAINNYNSHESTGTWDVGHCMEGPIMDLTKNEINAMCGIIDATPKRKRVSRVAQPVEDDGPYDEGTEFESLKEEGEKA